MSAKARRSDFHFPPNKRLRNMKIAVMPGDGIGHEVTAEAVKVLKAVVRNMKDAFGD